MKGHGLQNSEERRKNKFLLFYVSSFWTISYDKDGYYSLEKGRKELQIDQSAGITPENLQRMFEKCERL